MIKKIAFFLFATITLVATAQKKDKVLLTIQNEAVYSSEFLRIYNKNKDVVSDENKKNITEYLDLFINYKLKLKEARDLKLDTIPSYLKEFTKYKEQLIEPFLKDRKVTDILIKEAYNRMTKEIKASHILILVKPNASPKDTLKAYNTILAARKTILGGYSFKDMASKTSEDPSAKENGGDLGYFSAFSMVYPFENAAFNTPVGEVSMPFRTKFGFHIVKPIDIRESKGEIEVAHIMIHDKKTEPTYAKKQIDDIYNKYLQGEDFTLLAKKNSDDKSSAINGGRLRPFTQSKMIQPFADISFSLENIGDVSKPFKTKFGWHIVKLFKRTPLKSFDDSYETLKKKVQNGERSVMIGKSIITKLKNKYTYSFNNDLYDKAFPSEKDSKAIDQFDTKTLLTIEDAKYDVEKHTVLDYKKFTKKNREASYSDFINQKLTSYYKDHLEFENKEFANTLQEYRDGLLLFDLLQKKIWTKAEKDTVGLQDFFTKNTDKYIWKQRVQADIASCTIKDKALLVEKYMKDGKTVEEIKKLVNDDKTVHVLFQSGIFEIDSNKLPANFNVANETTLYTEDATHFSIVRTMEVIKSTPKKLQEVKGKVISNYQDFLEKQWIRDLRNTYSVIINKKVFNNIVRKNK